MCKCYWVIKLEQCVWMFNTSNLKSSGVSLNPIRGHSLFLWVRNFTLYPPCLLLLGHGNRSVSYSVNSQSNLTNLYRLSWSYIWLEDGWWKSQPLPFVFKKWSEVYDLLDYQSWSIGETQHISYPCFKHAYQVWNLTLSSKNWEFLWKVEEKMVNKNRTAT